MSDPMTNVEMDDVLSSIRRLVSEDSAEKVAADTVAADRFVLTPALRVDPVVAPSPEQQVAENIQPEPAAENSESPEELTGLLADAAAAAASAQGAPGSDAEDAPEVSEKFAAMEQAWKAELRRVAEVREKAGAGSPPPVEKSDPAEGKPSLELRIAELEEAVGQAEDEWEPDGSEPEVENAPRRHIFEVVDNTRNAPDESAPDPAADPVFSHAPRAKSKPYLLSDPPHTAELVDPGDNIADAADTDSDDLAIDPNENDASLDPDEQSTAQTIAFPTEGQSVVEDDDVFLDVEALRAMITDVVRDELQGKLGESITRNVRRMMQQEIAQALVDQTVRDDEN